ncbi:hypothetical protein HDV00_006972 [Rhizophlyctis rosea]|nr:hypothetical protein HDV00_006972 [Rhizophlyctis rosea]
MALFQSTVLTIDLSAYFKTRDANASFYSKANINSTVSTLNTSINEKQNTLITSAPLSIVNSNLAIDLSNYYTKSQVDTTFVTKQATSPLLGLASSTTEYTLLGTNATDGTQNTRIVIGGYQRSSSTGFVKNLPNLYIGNSAGGAGNKVGVMLSPWSGRTSPPVQLLAVDAGNGDAYFSVQVATGSTTVAPSEILRATQSVVSIGNNTATPLNIYPGLNGKTGTSAAGYCYFDMPGTKNTVYLGNHFETYGNVTVGQSINIPSGQIINFGYNQSKEVNAGKLRYSVFSTNGLDIVERGLQPLVLSTSTTNCASTTR